MAWTPEARQAAIEARQANAKGKASADRAVRSQGARKPGPQTAAHPNAGNRVAFAVRNKMQHDAGKDSRMRAAHQEGIRNAIGSGLGTLAKIALGITAGVGSVVLKGALKGGGRGGGGRGR